MVKVLIVDDEPLLGEELKEALELEDFEVDYVSSAVDGLDRCKAIPYDLIVTDLKMPNMNGVEFLSELAIHGERAQLIVISGHGAESNRDKVTELGAAMCFAKPFDVDEFTQELKSLVC